jgi:hypothetical protein
MALEARPFVSGTPGKRRRMGRHLALQAAALMHLGKGEGTRQGVQRLDMEG